MTMADDDVVSERTMATDVRNLCTHIFFCSQMSDHFLGSMPSISLQSAKTAIFYLFKIEIFLEKFVCFLRVLMP